MKIYIKSGVGDITYTRVVIILADNPIPGYDDNYYLPEYKMYLKTHDVIVNSISGEFLGKNKLHDILINELSGNNIPQVQKCAQATFENGRMQDSANLGILNKKQLDYINSLF